MGGDGVGVVGRRVCGFHVDFCVFLGKRKLGMKGVYIMCSSFPIFSKALMAKSRSFLVNAAFIIVRILALSRATIGKTIGSANTPSSKSLALSFLAIPLSPTITGVMGVSLLSMLKPRSFEFCWKTVYS